jgi:SAM-dependent methyltransferase
MEPLSPEAGGPSQRQIYDERFRGDEYDSRSTIRVLTAESEALEAAVARATSSVPRGPVSVMDFGYGTGRVTNEFVDAYLAGGAAGGRDLHVFAYDVSSVGLARAAQRLQADQGFVVTGEPSWRQDADETYVAATLERVEPHAGARVVLIHATEAGSADQMRDVVVALNGGTPVLLTTSWYSGLGHIPGRSHRQAVVSALGEMTDPRGELLLAVSSTGDLVEAQEYWDGVRERGGPHPPILADTGDVLYETELGQENYWHLFGEDLLDHVRAVTGEGQRCWVEGIRVPGDEFTSVQEEQANLRAVQELNRTLAGRTWTDEDYRRFHTILAVRSGSPVGADTTLGG